MGALPDTLNRSLQATASITVTELRNAGELAANNPDLYPKAQCSERLDERMCPLCRSVHRKVFDVRSDLFRRFLAPSHINCRRRWLYIHKDDPAPVTAVEPDPKLIEKHGHYHLDPGKHAELRLPAQPSGRQAIVRRVKHTETGEVTTRLDWAPWLEQVPASKLKLVLKARATEDAGELRAIAEALGVTDLTDPEQLQRAILLGIYDRLKGWVTTEYLSGGAATMASDWPVAAAPEAAM